MTSYISLYNKWLRIGSQLSFDRYLSKEERTQLMREYSHVFKQMMLSKHLL